MPGRPRVLLCTGPAAPPDWVAALPGRLADADVDVAAWQAPAWSAASARGAGGPLLGLVDEVLAAAGAEPFSAVRFGAALGAVADAAAGGLDLRAALGAPAVAKRTGRAALPWLGALLVPLAEPVPDAELVHVAGSGWAAGPAVVAASRAGTPLLVSDDDVFVRREVRAMERAGLDGPAREVAVGLVLALARTTYAAASSVTAACHYLQRWQGELGVEAERAEIVPDGVDPERFAPAAGRGGGDTVVQVAPVDSSWDTLTFVEVAAQVRRRRPGVRFVQHGEMADAGYAAVVETRLESLGLGDGFVLAGPADDRAAAYAGAAVVCLTPVECGYPSPAVEALMCGRPVVCTDTGGAREVVGRVGLLAPPGDVAAIAEAVERVLSAPAAGREAMGAEGRERALAHFSLDATIAAYRRLYARLLRAPRRAWGADAGPAAAPPVAPAADVDPVAAARAAAERLTADPDPTRRSEAVDTLARMLVADARANPSRLSCS